MPETFGAADRTDLFHSLHHRDRPLLLPNAWDYTSAAALADAGFPAVGTTSLGVSAAAGLPDAAGETRDETAALARRLGRLRIPVSVDLEAGFSTDPQQVAALAEALAASGVAGINLEDGRGNALADPAAQAGIITAVKERAPRLFVNARVDTYWLDLDHESTLARADQYSAAGADGIFVPGLREPEDVRRIAAAVALPLNVLYMPGGPTVAEFAALGARRISTGGLLFRAAVAATVDAARAVHDGRPLPEGIPSYRDIQALVANL
ncbi:isocitrate lyase/PEP mutase family protein [Nocardia mexicana]|nr:isocitrate lyase/phosphoenolpyruvate mutase family protein [Nocardia mexicana]